MKKVILVGIISLLSTGIYAQSFTDGLSKGVIQLTAGLGLNSHGLPLFVQMDYSVFKNVSISPYVGLIMWSPDNQLKLAVYADYHFNQLLKLPEAWDLYAGLNTGFRFIFSPQTETSGLKVGIQVGGRYFWNKNWGLNLQFGGGLDYGGRIGITHRF